MTTWPQSTSLASSPSDLNFAETGLREFTPASRTSCLGLRKLSGKITNQVVSHTEGKVTTKIGDQKRNQGYMWSQKFGIIKKIICRDFILEPHTRLRWEVLCQVITNTLTTASIFTSWLGVLYYLIKMSNYNIIILNCLHIINDIKLDKPVENLVLSYLSWFSLSCPALQLILCCWWISLSLCVSVYYIHASWIQERFICYCSISSIYLSFLHSFIWSFEVLIKYVYIQRMFD